MDKIMIIGANWEQKPLLQKAKEMGLYVTATNPYPEGEGFEHADDAYVVDPRNLPKVDEVFRKTKPDGVIADECDYSIFAVAYLTNKYGLSGPTMDSLIITNNKFLQRKKAKEAGIPQPEFRLCLTFREVEAAVAELGLPVMLKPLDNRGSIGVSRVFKKSDLEGAFYETIANSHSRQMLVEKFVKGEVVIVDGLYLDGFSNLSFSTKKMHPQYPDNAVLLKYPGDLKNKVIRELYRLNEKLVESCGINFGLTHTEFMVDGEQINLLEIANRGGGVFISNKIVPFVTGIDLSKFLILSSLGKKNFLPPLPKVVKNRGYGLMHVLDFGQGEVVEIRNVEKARRIPRVLALRLNFKVGDWLRKNKTAADRHGILIVAAKTLKKCNATIAEVEKTLEIKLAKKK